jgi:hypothetical protein
MGGLDQNGSYRNWVGGWVYSIGSGYGPVAGSCKHGNKPPVSGTLELVAQCNDGVNVAPNS